MVASKLSVVRIATGITPVPTGLMGLPGLMSIETTVCDPRGGWNGRGKVGAPSGRPGPAARKEPAAGALRERAVSSAASTSTGKTASVRSPRANLPETRMIEPGSSARYGSGVPAASIKSPRRERMAMIAPHPSTARAQPHRPQWKSQRQRPGRGGRRPEGLVLTALARSDSPRRHSA